MRSRRPGQTNRYLVGLVVRLNLYNNIAPTYTCFSAPKFRASKFSTSQNAPSNENPPRLNPDKSARCQSISATALCRIGWKSRDDGEFRLLTLKTALAGFFCLTQLGLSTYATVVFQWWMSKSTEHYVDHPKFSQDESRSHTKEAILSDLNLTRSASQSFSTPATRPKYEWYLDSLNIFTVSYTHLTLPTNREV